MSNEKYTVSRLRDGEYIAINSRINITGVDQKLLIVKKFKLEDDEVTYTAKGDQELVLVDSGFPKYLVDKVFKVDIRYTGIGKLTSLVEVEPTGKFLEECNEFFQTVYLTDISIDIGDLFYA